MNANIKQQYENLEATITSLKNCNETIMKIFSQAKSDYESMPYQSQEASKLGEVFNSETVSSFNKCCEDISNYITCLENAKAQYIAANEASLEN